MTWLFEDPTVIWIVGGFTAAVLLIAALSTGRAVYLAWLAGVVFVGVALLLVERFIVTDRELVEATIYGAKTAVEANDVEATLEHLAPAAEALRAEVRQRMQTMKMLDAAIAGLKIEFDPLDEDKAIATFLGRLEFSTSGLSRGQFFGRMTVELIKTEGRWLVVTYSLRRER